MREKIPQNTLGCKRKYKERLTVQTLLPLRDIDTIEDLSNLHGGSTTPYPTDDS
jgi:hypothetical protein